MANNPLLGSFGDVSGSGLMFRNKIINGAMVIDQRNAGASKTPIDGEYLLDRWRAGVSAASKFSVQQVSTAPVGFSNSLQCTSLSAYSVTTNDNFEIFQLIEGFNTFDLSFGTANAKTITLSFWVRSSLTGTFGGSILNSAFNRSYPFSYTISAANTWEYKTITIPGDTSGTWIGATNGAGLILCLGLGAGSGRSGTAGSWSGSTFYNATGATSIVGTNGATILFAGVQLEAGPQATPFEQRPLATELILCQRYFEKSFAQNIAPAANLGDTRRAVVTSYLSNDTVGYIPFLVTKRAVPVMTSYAAISTGSNWHYWTGSTFTQVSTTLSPDEYRISVGMTITGTVGQSWMTAGQWTASCEL